jgi:inorganic phosphate transporter, PiT family
MTIDVVLFALTLIIGFYMAWNIGANDVSNAMGTSVGSKALTLRKAVIIAALLEFSGAFLLGSHVSETIQSGIVNPDIFASDRMIFIIGMLGALFATGIWLNLASFLKLPVSTTHAIVGAVLGFGLLIGGMHAIYWSQISTIAIGWVVSPVLSGVISYFIFLLIQQKIFYAFNPFESTKRLVPLLIFFAFSIFSLSLIFNGLNNLNISLSFPIALLISIVIGLIAFFISIFLLKRIPFTSLRSKICASPHQFVSLEKASKHLERIKLASKGETQEHASNILKEVKKLKQSVKEEAQFSQTAEEYKEVEGVFAYLQIISACLVAFAHGANDVANAIGPVSAVIQVLQFNVIDLTSRIPLWVLLFGASGIVVGLATWGWRVMETIGKKITELTPTRGFSAEFGAALTILLASRLGLPISTTHALVGSVLGVGIARGIRALNLKTLKDIVFSWVITIPICAILSIIIFYLLKAIFL